jgi:hypothetical protein
LRKPLAWSTLFALPLHWRQPPFRDEVVMNIIGTRGRCVWVAAALTLAAGTASAQKVTASTWPVGTSIGGTVQGANGAECGTLGSGSASFITGKHTFLNIPTGEPYNGVSLFVFPENLGDYQFSFVGALQLKFTSATSGTVTFDSEFESPSDGILLKHPPRPPAVTFSDYQAVETYNPTTLTVTFTLHFLDCALPEKAIFRQAD